MISVVLVERVFPAASSASGVVSWDPEPGGSLASAIFVDATIVRVILVPATMELLGTANWWLPHWLDRIVPRISVEAPPELAAAVPHGGTDLGTGQRELDRS